MGCFPKNALVIVLFGICVSCGPKTGSPTPSTENVTASTRSSQNQKSFDRYYESQELKKCFECSRGLDIAVTFVHSVSLNGMDRNQVLLRIATDLAEANGAVDQHRRSKFEVVRTVVADYVSSTAVALNALLDGASSRDDVKIARALADLQYLGERYETVRICLFLNDLSC